MLFNKLRSLFPALTDADFSSLVVLQDDGSGPYIAKWNHPTIARPSDAEIAAAVDAPAEPRQFTPLDFLDLFTQDEQLAVVLAGMQNAAVKLWYDRALAAQFITIADPRTEGGLSALVSGGLLTAERKAEIVGAML